MDSAFQSHFKSVVPLICTVVAKKESFKTSTQNLTVFANYVSLES